MERRRHAAAEYKRQCSRTMECRSIGRAALVVVLGILIPLAVLGAADGPTTIENKLADIAVGSNVKQLRRRYPTLYSHDMPMGETLYEACNQKDLHVFNFSDQPWSKGFITYISIRQESNVMVCRDQQGSLPDLGIKPATPRGVSLGTTEQDVKAKYGTPTEEKQLPDAVVRLTYIRGVVDGPPHVENLRLVFLLRSGKVSDISLMAEMPAVKKPHFP